jgi:hypothetical protein
MAANERPVALSSPLVDLERHVRTITRPAGEPSVSEFFFGHRFAADRRRRLKPDTAGDWFHVERNAGRRV